MDATKADKSDREKGSDDAASHSTSADAPKVVAEPHVLYLWIGEGSIYSSIYISVSQSSHRTEFASVPSMQRMCFKI